MVNRIDIKPSDPADFIVNQGTNLIGGIANSIPFGETLDIGNYIKRTPAVRNLQSTAHAAITRETSDKNSWLGQIFQGFVSLLSNFSNWIKNTIDSMFGKPDEKTSPQPEPTSAGNGAQKGPIDPKVASAAREVAQSGVDIGPSSNATDMPSPTNTPAGSQAPAAGKTP